MRTRLFEGIFVALTPTSYGVFFQKVFEPIGGAAK
jgi:hypothetical protein